MRLALLSIVFLSSFLALADELPRVKPKTPADSLADLVLRPGFRAELVTNEPLVTSPVALDFDEDGRLYVAEYPEYNQYGSTTPHGRGRIRRLEDREGDGVYESSSIFAADLDSPGAVLCYDGGIFVAAAPDLLYLKDTTGDGVADQRQVIFTGFGKDKAGEGMLNSFRWGPDNRIHISCGLAGGDVRLGDQPDTRPFSVRGFGLAFDPRTKAHTLTGGGGQHGMSLDDFGRKFTCGNSDPALMVMYDAADLARNPAVAAPAAAINIAPQGKFTKLFRISPPEPWRELRTRLRSQKIVPGSDEGGQAFGFFTGGTGATIYRGNAFPPSHRGNLFVGDVANNLVYRARLEPNGVGFTAVRADDGVEFLASKDNWFRPVQFANAPDGCLYVIDMYRELIEGAAFLPPQVLKQVDPAGGVSHGRIYRIVPETFTRPPQPKLSKATTAELVALLNHANGWHRDTAARLLSERRDAAAVPALRQLAAEATSPVGRLHALSTLRTLDALTAADVSRALGDAAAEVREHAVRLAEPFAGEPALLKALVALADDPAPRVRYQLAFALGGIARPEVVPVLEALAVRDAGDAWMRLAVLTSAGGRSGDLFARLASRANFRDSAPGRDMLTALVAQTGASARRVDIEVTLQAIEALPASADALARAMIVTLTKARPAGASDLLARGKASAVLATLLTEAKATVSDEARKPAERVNAVQALALAPWADVKPALTGLLEPRQPGPVQTAALGVLATFDSPEVAPAILRAWPAMSPSVRTTAIETLLARPAGVAAFLDAVEKQQVARGEVDPARVQLLQAYPDPKLRERAARLFAGTGPGPRAEIVKQYQPALTMKGDVARGRAIFRKECAGCHKLENVGQAIGADLQAIKDRGLEAVLLNIIDPNREVKPQYFSYVLQTDDGQVIAGMIAAETATSVTIRRPDGTSETVLRGRIEELKSSGLSYMPEGIEKQVDVAGMADLLAYLASVK